MATLPITIEEVRAPWETLRGLGFTTIPRDVTPYLSPQTHEGSVHVYADVRWPGFGFSYSPDEDPEFTTRTEAVRTDIFNRVRIETHRVGAPGTIHVGQRWRVGAICGLLIYSETLADSPAREQLAGMIRAVDILAAARATGRMVGYTTTHDYGQ